VLEGILVEVADRPSESGVIRSFLFVGCCTSFDPLVFVCCKISKDSFGAQHLFVKVNNTGKSCGWTSTNSGSQAAGEL
jgi:hypothetical protein